MNVSELEPGDVIDDDVTGRAIVVTTQYPHPLYPRLSLVVWWMVSENRYSLDALHPEQFLGATSRWVRRSTDDLRTALHGPR